MRKIILVFFLLSMFSKLNLHAQVKSSEFTNNSIAYIENKGQILDQNDQPNYEVLYLLNMPQFKLQIRKSGFSYDTYTIEKTDIEEPNYSNEINSLKGDYKLKLNFHRVDIELIGANNHCEIKAEQPLDDHLNYFSNHIKNKVVYGVKQYQKITYIEIYPKIDLEFIIDKGKPKYNFILHRGANLKEIKWKYLGASYTKINGGKILIGINGGVLSEDIPLSYYKAENEHEEAILKYRKISENTYGFHCKEEIDLDNTLVIDPVPEVMWASYYGGLLRSEALTITVDSEDNVYFGGVTKSAANIASSGAFQTTMYVLGGGYYAKFNKEGLRLYGTFYSGIGRVLDVECDKNDNLIISGLCLVDSLGTIGAFQQYRPMGQSGHIAKFDKNGTRIWATYFGTEDPQSFFSINSAIDSSDNVLITGTMSTTDSIFTTPGAYQTWQSVSKYGLKGYLSKLDTNGNLVWGTYIASNNLVKIYAITTDKWNNIIVGGRTNGNINIGTPGTFMPNLSYPSNISRLAFLMKFNSAGQKTWGTYYGSPSMYGQGIICWINTMTTDNTGHIYFAGKTDLEYANALDTLGTTGVYQTSYGGGEEDAFIVKFNSNGTRNWASYYGGSDALSLIDNDRATGLSSDLLGNIYMTGFTNSPNNIASTNVLKSVADTVFVGMNQVPHIQVDGFIAKFNSVGQRVYGTYFGSDTVDYLQDIKIDHYGKILVAGSTMSLNLYTNSSSFQPNSLNSGSLETAHVGRLSDCDISDIPQISAIDNIVCPGELVTINISGQLNDATHWSIYHNGLLLGSSIGNTYQLTVNDTLEYLVKGAGGCVVKSDGGIIGFQLDSIPEVFAGKDTSICTGQSLNIFATGTAVSYVWSNGFTNGTSYSPTYSHQLYVTGTGMNSCTNTDTINITVNQTPYVTYTNGFSKICHNAPPRPVFGGKPIGGLSYYTGVGMYNDIFYPDSAGPGSHPISYVYTTPQGCSASAVDSILVEVCPGFEDLSLNYSCKLYPNPAHESIIIETEGLKGDYSIEIIDNKGSILQNLESNTSINKVQLISYTPAVYYYRIVQEKKILYVGVFIIE